MKTVVAPDHQHARDALAHEIAALREVSPLDSILIITPTDLAREETRRFLARRLAGLLGVRVLSLAEWVRELAEPEILRREERLLSEPAFERLIARTIDEELVASPGRRGGRWGPLARAADTPGITSLVRATVEDLLEAGFEPEHLDSTRSLSPDPLRADVVRFFSVFWARLRSQGRYDRRRQEILAAEVLAKAAAPGPPTAAILLHGFHDLTALQRALATAAAEFGHVTLLIPGGEGAGDAATVPLLDWARSNGSVLEVLPSQHSPLVALAETLFQPPHLVDPGPAALELQTYSHESAEVRGIARRIRAEIQNNEIRFGDILVVVPPTGPSPLLFRRIFTQAGIPLNDRAGIPASRSVPARRALALARALAGASREREWEALRFLSGEDAIVARIEPEIFRRAADWEAGTRVFRDHYSTVFQEAVPTLVEECLSALEEVWSNTPFSGGRFARSLASTLTILRETKEIGVGAKESGVLLLRLDQARGVKRPLVFFTGLVEGAYIRTPREDPLLPDYWREELNAHHQRLGRTLPLKGEAGPENILLARFAFACAERRAVLSWARRSRTGAENRNPSGLLLDVAAGRARCSLAPDSADFLAQVPVPAPHEAVAEPADRIDLELALLLGVEQPGEEELARLLRDERGCFLPAALQAAASRWQPESLGPYDAVLQREETREAVRNRLAASGTAWSPTALETLLNCPFSFLVRHVLRLEPPRESEDDLDPRERGTIFHMLLEEVYRDLVERGEIPLTTANLPTALGVLDDRVVRHRERLAKGPARRRLLRHATLALLRDDIALLLAREAHQSLAARGEPIHFELRFGPTEESETAAPVFPLTEEDATLPLRGTIDRIDLAPDGSVQIIEYKAGARRARAGRITAVHADKTVVHLQLPLYLEAAASLLGRPPGRAIYYHATAEHGFAEIPFTAADLEAARGAIGRLLSRALACVEQGWFPSLPGDTCCQPDLAPACGAAAAARFRCKRGDAGIVEHLAMLRTADGEDSRPANAGRPG